MIGALLVGSLSIFVATSYHGVPRNSLLLLNQAPKQSIKPLLMPPLSSFGFSLFFVNFELLCLHQHCGVITSVPPISQLIQSFMLI